MKIVKVSDSSQKMAIDTVEPMNVPLPASPVRSYRHYMVGLVSFLYITAYNMSSLSFGHYLYEKLQREFYPNATNISSTITICTEDAHAIQLHVQEKAAKWGIYLYLSGSLVAIISNFVLGAYTDRFGRKFLFSFPCIGTILRTSSVIIGFHFDLPLWYYAFGYFVEGCTGQAFNILQVSFLYVVDITVAGKQRSFGIVLMELIFGMGTIVPNLATGYLHQYFNSFLWPVIVSDAILVITFLLMLTLPETFPKHLREKRKYNSNYKYLKDSVDLYVSSKNAGRRWMYIIVLVVFALTSYDLFGRIAIEGLYLLNFPLCWDPKKIGLYRAARSGAQQLIGMSLAKLFHMFMNDEMIAIIGSVSYGASFVMEAYAHNEAMMYGGRLPYLVSCKVFPYLE